MRAKSFTGPFACAVLILLAGLMDFDSVSSGVVAQGNATAAAQGGRGGRGGAPVDRAQLPPGGGRGRGAPPGILGPPAGAEPLPLGMCGSKTFYKGTALRMDK